MLPTLKETLEEWLQHIFISLVSEVKYKVNYVCSAQCAVQCSAVQYRICVFKSSACWLLEGHNHTNRSMFLQSDWRIIHKLAWYDCQRRSKKEFIHGTPTALPHQHQHACERLYRDGLSRQTAALIEGKAERSRSSRRTSSVSGVHSLRTSNSHPLYRHHCTHDARQCMAWQSSVRWLKNVVASL